MNIENLDNWHGKAITGSQGQEVVKHLQSLIKSTTPFDRNIPKPVEDAPKIDIRNVKLDTPPNYKLGELVATRLAYGTALAKVNISGYCGTVHKISYSRGTFATPL